MSALALPSHLMEKSCIGDKATQPSGHLGVPRSVRNSGCFPLASIRRIFLGTEYPREKHPALP